MPEARGTPADSAAADRPEDRRRHRRFLPRECALALMKEPPALLRVFGAGSTENIAQAVVDLSEGGARFITDRPLDVGARVRVSIGLKLFRDQIDAYGRVHWVQEDARSRGRYVVAVRFRRLDPADGVKIGGLRDYLGSPEYRQKEDTRRRRRPPIDTSSLEYDR